MLIIILGVASTIKHLHEKGKFDLRLKIYDVYLDNNFEPHIGLVRIHEILDSRFSYVNDSLTKGVGTFAYMSPEMLNSEDYDYKTDVYSFGVVLNYIFIGKMPKQNLKDKLNGKLINLPSESSEISKFCIKLIKKYLAPKPLNRLSFEEILERIRDNKHFHVIIFI